MSADARRPCERPAAPRPQGNPASWVWLAVCVGLLALPARADGLLRVALSRAAGEVAFSGSVTAQPPGGAAISLIAPRVKPIGAALDAGGRRLPPGTRFTAAGPIAMALGGSPARAWRGAIVLHLSGGKLTVVNEVALEHYLRGVVPGEIGSSAPPAALQAQAIAARSYALQRRAGAKGKPYDLDVAASQVYGGVAVERASTDAAVAATAGRILTDGRAPLDALYHACCGGATAGADEAWGRRHPLLVAVIDLAAGVLDAPPPSGADEAAVRRLLDDGDAAWCHAHSRFRWQRELTAAALSKAVGPRLGKLARGAKVGEVRAVEVAGRGASGRVADLLVRGSAGNAHVRGDAIRWLFGTGQAALPSTLFVIDARPDGVLLRGAGWGHGVGLCQAGAMGQAAEGWSAEAILRHYYPGASLEDAP